MFVYLSKKISVLNGANLSALAWNTEQGWIAAGGEKGLLKVLKLEHEVKGSKAVSMNQTLEGHSGHIRVATWNEPARKLTTSDENGLIIVWTLQKGMWYEEMINNRNKSVVSGMRWTHDGQKICIIYEDGAVIVGSVEGNRIWGKELPLSLSHVEWSPDGRVILFCTQEGECHVYDSEGKALSQAPLRNFNKSAIAGLEWLKRSKAKRNEPSLAIALTDGRLHIMRHESDDSPFSVNTSLQIHRLKWSSSGGALAIAGKEKGRKSSPDVIHIYSNYADLLQALRVPGTVESLCWEGGDRRIALAIDAFIYFATVRPEYKWAFFSDTIVYQYTRETEDSQSAVVFWDVRANEAYFKPIPSELHAVAACGSLCALAVPSEEADMHELLICNTLGSVIATKQLTMVPRFLAMTEDYIVVASHFAIQVIEHKAFASSDAGGERTTWLAHVDDPGFQELEHASLSRLAMKAQDKITSLAARGSVLLVARESGLLQRYPLPPGALESTQQAGVAPKELHLNCDQTVVGVISQEKVLTFQAIRPYERNEENSIVSKQSRRDVWGLCWAEDNAEWVTVMEKNSMTILFGADKEEKHQSANYLCSFKDLRVETVALDQVMSDPERPSLECFVKYKAQALQETQELIRSKRIQDALEKAEKQPHPSLWRSIAEHALNVLDLETAKRAFLRGKDYEGVQFVKRLKVLGDEGIQKAEVMVRSQQFDEAETLFKEMDRADLAIEMRMRIGDWFRVERLVKAGYGNDKQLQIARDKIGDFFADRQQWSQAIPYYSHARNTEKLIRCFTALEDYKGMEQLLGVLPDGSDMLNDLGKRFTAVGLSEPAVSAYIKANNVTAAVNSCVVLHQWDKAVELAEQYSFQQIEGLLSRYSAHLLEQGKEVEAVELYRKANKNIEAAKMLHKMAVRAASEGGSVQRVKKLHLLAALEADSFKRRALNAEAEAATAKTSSTKSAPTTKSKAATTLDTLMTAEQSLNEPGADAQSSWRTAEGNHFLLLAHQKLYRGDFYAALRAALALSLYEDAVGTLRAQCLVAIAAFYSGHLGRCSRALTKLENLGSLSQEQRSVFSDVALAIFTRFSPQDPGEPGRKKGNVSIASLPDDPSLCDKRSPGTSLCVATASPLPSGYSGATQCATCRHWTLESEAAKKDMCAMCHARLTSHRGHKEANGFSKPPSSQASRGATPSLAPWEVE